MGIEDKAKAMDVKGVILTLVISSFGFVAALFWRDAVKDLINEFVPEGQGLIYSFGTAVLVTIIAVVVIFLVSKYMTRSIIRETVTKTLTRDGREKIIKSIYDIDNKLVGRDITIRKKGVEKEKAQAG